MKPSVFTGRIRHLGFEILVWFVAQGFRVEYSLFCGAALLVSVALAAPKNNKSGL